MYMAKGMSVKRKMIKGRKAIFMMISQIFEKNTRKVVSKVVNNECMVLPLANIVILSPLKRQNRIQTLTFGIEHNDIKS